VLYVIVKTMIERFGPKPRVLPEGCEEEAVVVGGGQAVGR